MLLSNNFEVIIIGGGHAGIEAAYIASKMKCKTLLLTHDINSIGEMFCNPSIGGIGKGHLVKEIDAMGGLMAKAADQSGIHFKILNTSKGRAVRSTRAQIDKILYKNFVQCILKKQRYLTILEGIVNSLIVNNNKIVGVILFPTKEKIFSKAVILSTGTFLKGKIHIGMSEYNHKKIGNLKLISNTYLPEQLKDMGFHIGRLKTGTSPRIRKNSIDFSLLSAQYSDIPVPFFSCFYFFNNHPKQIPCYITHTNSQTHELIYENLRHSPLFTKKIKGIGPRYCPSIEDKVIKFPYHNSHQIFLEPEGLNSEEIYLNGISTSLPKDIQVKVIRSIFGLKNACIIKPGYAIEYDFLDPRYLKLTLESKIICGLFCAGQINGTTGYEEAAAQGLLAGINAVQFVRELTGWFPRRDQAYLGVLVDDLCTQGIDEPYRMFTSRAEYRLLLREGNADIRLTRIARKLHLISDDDWNFFCQKEENIQNEYNRIKNIQISPSDYNKHLHLLSDSPLKSKINLEKLLCRPEITCKKLINVGILKSCFNDCILEEIEIQVKYQGYIDRQKKEISYKLKYESLFLPENLNFNDISGLSKETVDKLNNYRPTSLGQMSRISGITPSSILILLIWLKKRGLIFSSKY